MKLKNDRMVVVKEIAKNHVEKRHHFFLKLAHAEEGMVHTSEEIGIHFHETNDKIIDFLKNQRGLWLVAFDQNQEIVGEVDIFVSSGKKVRHNARLSIGILPQYQGIGLGTKLMEKALSWAQKNQILRLELNVFSSNLKAINLYRKFGFQKEGIRKNYLRHQDGTFEDDFLMAKYFFCHD